MKIVTRLFNRGDRNSVKGGTSLSPSRNAVKGGTSLSPSRKSVEGGTTQSPSRNSVNKDGTKLSPSGPFWRSRNRIEDDDSEDDNRIENQSTVTGVMYAAMSSAGVYYEKSFEDTLQSVNQDLYKIFAEGSLVDKTQGEDSSKVLTSLQDNAAYILDTSVFSFTHENPKEESDPTEIEKTIGVSDWNELTEEHEVTRDEFMRDVSVEKSGNSFLKRYRK